MWRLVDADVDAAHVFADKPEQQHNHAAHKEQGGEHAGIAHRDFREHEFFVNHEQTRAKADESTQYSNKGRGAERLHGECGKAVNPEPDKSGDRIAGFAFKTATVLYFDIAQVLGGAENEAAYIGKRVGIAHDFVDNELAHNEETCGAQCSGLADDVFGHFLVDPCAESAE